MAERLDPRGPNKFEPGKRSDADAKGSPHAGDHDAQDRKRKQQRREGHPSGDSKR